MSPRHLLPHLATWFTLLAGVNAQCADQWLPGDGVPGVEGTVFDIVIRDPDGSGPLPARVVVGGDIFLAGDVATKGIAEWDPTAQHWSALANGLSSSSNSVRDLLLAPNGDLYAAGSFRFGSDFNHHVCARWNGSTWSPVGITNGHAEKIAMMPNGDLVVGGSFDVLDASGSWVEGNLAVWDGATMSTPFGGVDGKVWDVVVRPSGELVARGDFWTTGGIVSTGLASWDGANWSPMQGSNWASAGLALLPNGNVVATQVGLAGAGTPVDVAIWDGSTWTLLPPTGYQPSHVLVRGNGDLLVTTTDFSSLPLTERVLRWTGTGWSPLNLGRSGTPMAEDSNGDLLFRIGWSEDAVGVGRWDGATWSFMGSGMTSTAGLATHGSDWALVEALARMPNGHLIAGGAFAQIGGVQARCVARWDGTNWSPLGAGLDGRVVALAAMPNGDIVAAGEFTLGAGLPTLKIAKWDGSTWSALPWTQIGSIRALVVLPDGDLIAAGSFWEPTFTTGFGILRWDGTSWHSLRMGVGGSVNAMVVLPNGDLVVGGEFVEVDRPTPFAGGGILALRIARWDGAAWSPIAGGMNARVDSLTVMANGDLVAGGAFSVAGSASAYGVARFDGAQWSAMGPGFGTCRELASLPGGDVVGASFQELRRWNGSTWAPIAQMQDVRTLLFHGDQLLAGGNFHGNEFQVSVGLARLATNCPPSATATGTGCAGAALAVRTLPWVDDTLRTIGTGLPTMALVVTATGFLPASPPLPLSALLPQALPGCELSVLPDLLQTLTTTTGMAESSLYVPSAPAIVGLSFHQQMIAFDVDAAGAIAGVVSTNALQLVAGQF